MAKRTIRLKEFPPSSMRVYKPPEEYIASRPDIDSRTAFATKIDVDGFLETGNHIYSSNKIFVLGDSFGENLYVDQSNRFSSKLEHDLTISGYDVQVLNASVSGATTINLINTFVNKIIPYRPVCVIFIVPSNDLPALSLSGKYWNGDRFFSNLVFEGRRCIPKKIDQVNNVDVFRMAIESLVEIARVFRVSLLAVTTPHATYDDNSFVARNNRESYLEIFRKRESLNEIAKEVFSSKGIPFIEGNFSFDGRRNFYDSIHLTDAGSLRFANSLFNLVSTIDLPRRNREFRAVLLLNESELADQTVWCDKIYTSNEVRSIALLFEVECSERSGNSVALFCCKFLSGDAVGGEGTNLMFSNYQGIGWYRYIDVSEGNRMDLSYRIDIPLGITSVEIGLRKWTGAIGPVVVKNVRLYISNS